MVDPRTPTRVACVFCWFVGALVFVHTTPLFEGFATNGTHCSLDESVCVGLKNRTHKRHQFIMRMRMLD